MFTIYLSSKFHAPGSTDSLFVALRLKNQEIFRTVFEVFSLKNNYNKKKCILF